MGGGVFQGACFLVLSYLCGSLPTAVWWGKVFFGIDVREHGSRNAGATNTFRVLGARAGVPVLMIDVLKGWAPVHFLPALLPLPQASAVGLQIVLSITAVLGHLYPVFARFKGGKGVATSLGTLLAVHPAGALVCVAVFLLVFLASGYVSLGSLLAAASFPLLLLFRPTQPLLLGYATVLAALVWYTHRQNIGRLWRGKEGRMSPFGKRPSQ
jgi:acyl phosphate:glycerol-3-phosphate acyltransferase